MVVLSVVSAVVVSGIVGLVIVTEWVPNVKSIVMSFPPEAVL